MAPEVLRQARVSPSQQGRKSAPLVEQTGEPGPLPRLRQCGAGAPVASQANPGYWKRPAKTSSTLQEVLPLQVAAPKERCKNDFSATVTRSRRVARSSAAGTYRPFDRLTVTRERGASHPAAATEGPNHSGPAVRNENQRKHICRSKNECCVRNDCEECRLSSVGWINAWCASVISTVVTTPPGRCTWCWSRSPTPKASATTPMRAWSGCSAWSTPACVPPGRNCVRPGWWFTSSRFIRCSRWRSRCRRYPRPVPRTGQTRSLKEVLAQVLNQRRPTMIDYATYCQIRSLRQEQKLSVGQIARQLQLDKKTVRYWLKHDYHQPQRAPAAPANSTLTSPASSAWLEAHDLSAQQILQRLAGPGRAGRLHHRARVCPAGSAQTGQGLPVAALCAGGMSAGGLGQLGRPSPSARPAGGSPSLSPCSATAACSMSSSRWARARNSS